MRAVRAKAKGWNSPNGVTGIAVAAALVVLAACGALIQYEGHAVDTAMAQRQAALLRNAVRHEILEIEEDIRPPTVWTEAWQKVRAAEDWKWIHLNFGDNYQRYRGHSVTVIFDGADRPIYASAADRQMAVADQAGFIAAARPLLAATRAREAARLAKDPRAVGQAREVSGVSALRVGDDIYFAAGATIVPEDDYRGAMPAGPGPVVITAKVVSGETLGDLNTQFGLRDTRLMKDGPYPEGATLLTGDDGRVVAAFASTPERPVLGVLAAARWQIGGLALVVAAVVAALILSLRGLARRLLDARDRAEAGDRAKSEFIANMSHEIRTPLNGVLGMAQVMDAHELSPAQRDRLRVMRDSGAALLTLLNELLDFAKIEAGKLEIEAATFDLGLLLREVAATFEGVAGAKGLELAVAIAPEAEGAWLGDALRIRQVLSNLVSNAVKFTDRGGVTLSAALEGEALRFRVVDTGIGLTAAQIPGLFDKFSQADSSTTRRYGGTGLGLAIVQALTDLMGGEVFVDSRPGEGACFTVMLPLVRATEAPAQVAARPVVAPSERSLRILAAEDNPTNQLVLKAMLEPLGPDLVLASNGREALAAFAAGGFDVVLMDVQMPEMNGVDAVRAIRALEAKEGRPRTPVLALTANVMSHQIDGYLAAGMDGHIAKPIEIAALYAALEGVMARASEELAA